MRRRVAIKVMQARDDRCRQRPRYRWHTIQAADAKLWRLGPERTMRIGRHNVRVIVRLLGGMPAVWRALGMDGRP